ncbi:hypothetical protein PRIPAC_70028 [Pristionchus pacificus]|uniref:Uncharacterized protein n=1 Tax=Pristionchus pacificus TaxID=54126 RepID=A0A2A6CG46_PRIPA|nr:hypothetical protein PRIPAC_70028 [Pristionchus pacificus]|eukprot:PDM77076.1 hypothetical protein PRIPAC_42471 [Pristionchus pacificus]
MKFTRSLLLVALVGLISASLAAKTLRKASQRAQDETKAARCGCGCGCGCGCCGCGCCKRKRRDQSAVVKGNKKNTTSRFARIKRSLGIEEPEQTKIEKEDEFGAMTKKSRKSRAKKAPPSGVKSPLNEREDCPSPEIDPLWEIPPDAIKLGYPSENMCLTDLEGTLKEIEKQLTDVMEDRYITCDFPIKKTSSISMKLANELVDRSTKGAMRIDHLIESIIDKDDEETEENIYESERDFRQDLIKYILFATAQFNNSSIGTALATVEDLHANAAKVLEYEFGCPVKCASTVFEFYNLTKDQFESFNEKAQLEMKKYYLKEVLRYQRDMQKFLTIKGKQLRGSENGDVVWKCMEAELAEALDKNREMGIVMKEHYDYIANRDDLEKGEYRNSFHSFSLKEQIGARTREEEMEINRKFACTPVRMLKTLIVDRKETRKIKFDMSAFPTTMNTVDADHSVIPRPPIDHLADLV